MSGGKPILVLLLGMALAAGSETVARGEVLESVTTPTWAGLEGSPIQTAGANMDVGGPSVVRGQDCGGYSDCGEVVCCDSDSCCVPRLRMFGDIMYIRPRNAEVNYAVPFDGPVVPPPAVPIQFGRVATVDPDYEPAFRVGFERCLNSCSSIGVTYSHLDTSTSDAISVDAPLVLRSMVIHPSTLNAEADWLDAAANQTINYRLVDLDYRRVWLCGPRHRVSYMLGARYGRLEQYFQSTFSSLETEWVNTDIDFDGGGIRLGLEGERQAACSGFLVYGRAEANVMAGEFRGRYVQGNDSDPEIVDASWEAGRLVPTLDLELGVGWASQSGCLRMTAGYMVSAWYNIVRTSDFIDAVQTNDFGELHDTMTFDGLVVRTELRY